MTPADAPTLPPQLGGYEADRMLGTGTGVTYWLGRRSGDGAAVGLSAVDAPLVRLSGFGQRLAAVVRQVAPLSSQLLRSTTVIERLGAAPSSAMAVSYPIKIMTRSTQWTKRGVCTMVSLSMMKFTSCLENLSVECVS